MDIIDPVPTDYTRVISKGLDDFNDRFGITRSDFAVVEFDKEKLLAGLTASVSMKTLFINTIWVADHLRRSSVGTKLLEKAEKEGRRRGVRQACVDTLCVQAPDFYVKNGYTEFGRLPNMGENENITRIWFRKDL